MRIGSILVDSMAEVEGHVTDVIFFQGCSRDCPFCYNPELQDFNMGTVMSVEDIIRRLSSLSSVVVLTGGEPSIQGYEVLHLVKYLKSTGKKVILETSSIFPELIMACDKVYFSIKTFNSNDDYYGTPYLADKYDNVEMVVVIGHQWFDIINFRQILKNIKKEIWVKYYNDLPCDDIDVYHMIKVYQKPWKVLRKLQL